MPRLLLLTVLLLCLPAAQAQQWDDADPTALASAAAQDAHATRLANTLDRAGGARERALAALLRQAAQPQPGAPLGDAPSRRVPRDPQTETRLRQALDKAGDDVLALQLLAAATADQPSLREEAVRRWQAADRGNLVPLLQAALPADTLLTQTRAATRADARMYEGMRWIMSVYMRHPPTPAEQAALAAGNVFQPGTFAALAATAVWSATAMPRYGTIVEACGERVLRAVPARTADCRQLAGLLTTRADTVAGQVAGLAMLHALDNTPIERAELTKLQRPMDWRMSEWGRAAAAQTDQGLAQFARLLADETITTEAQLVDHVLREAGIARDPPEGWTLPRR